MPIVLTTFEDFVKEQGDAEYILLNPHAMRDEPRRYLFSNGAQSDGQTVHIEPPDDPVDLARLRLKFLKLKLEAETKQYRESKSAIADQIRFYRAGAGPMPSGDWQGYLEQQGAQIQSIQSEIDALTASLPETEKAIELARQRAERTNAARDAMYKLNEFANY